MALGAQRPRRRFVRSDLNMSDTLALLCFPDMLESQKRLSPNGAMAAGRGLGGGRLKGGRIRRISSTPRKPLPQRLPQSLSFGSFLVRTQERNTAPLSSRSPFNQQFQNQRVAGRRGRRPLQSAKQQKAASRQPFVVYSVLGPRYCSMVSSLSIVNSSRYQRSPWTRLMLSAVTGSAPRYSSRHSPESFMSRDTSLPT